MGLKEVGVAHALGFKFSSKPSSSTRSLATIFVERFSPLQQLIPASRWRICDNSTKKVGGRGLPWVNNNNRSFALTAGSKSQMIGFFIFFPLLSFIYFTIAASFIHIFFPARTYFHLFLFVSARLLQSPLTQAILDPNLIICYSMYKNQKRNKFPSKFQTMEDYFYGTMQPYEILISRKLALCPFVWHKKMQTQRTENLLEHQFLHLCEFGFINLHSVCPTGPFFLE